MLTQRIVLEDSDFSLKSTVESHGWFQLPPFHYEDGILSRVHRMPDARIVHIHVQQTGNTSRENFLLVETDGPVFMTDQFTIASNVRNMLCMEWDLQPFYDLLRDLPEYAWVEPNQTGRLLRAPTVWEDLAKTLLTTNTTWRQTVLMCQRLNALGDNSPFGHAFPTPAQIATMDVDALTDHIKAGYRGAYLHKLANDITSGSLDVEQWSHPAVDSHDLYKQITSLAGFGPYAAGSMLRLLGHHDYLSIDTVARDAFARCHRHGVIAPNSELKAHYEPYGKWRGLVMWMDVLRDEE